MLFFLANLTGSLADLSQINSITSLQYFITVANQLSGTLPFTASMTSLKMLWMVDEGNLNGGPAISGTLPPTSSLDTVISIMQSLSGTLPPTAIANVTTLLLAYSIAGPVGLVFPNPISGSVPASLENPNLKHLFFLNTKISATLPPVDRLNSQSGLVAFHLMYSDKVLPFGFGRVSGRFLEGMRWEQMLNLTVFQCTNCLLSGTISNGMYSAPRLEFLELFNSSISGSLPEAMSTNTVLKSLVLSKNEALSGVLSTRTHLMRGCGRYNAYIFGGKHHKAELVFRSGHVDIW